jgi:protein gp37
MTLKKDRTTFDVLFQPLESLPDLDLRDIDWVIIGGESGPGARSIEEVRLSLGEDSIGCLA